jgi:hypothetical protein
MEEDEGHDRHVKPVVVQFQLLNIHERQWPGMFVLGQSEHPF